MLLAPIATPVAATGAGRSLFFAMERGRAWQVPTEDAHRLLLDFAQAPGYLETVQAAMVDVPTRLERISLMIRSLSPRACCGSSRQRPEKRNTAEGCQHSGDPGSASRSRRRPAPVQTTPP
jgi:hypothetical protein